MYKGFYDILEMLVLELKNKGCKVVTFGDSPEYDRQKNTVTPAAHIAPMSFSVPPFSQANGSLPSTRRFQFEIFIYGLLSHYKEGETGSAYGYKNTVDVLDESIWIADRFTTGLSGRTKRLGEKGYVRFVGGVTFTPVLDEGDNGVAGVIGTLDIEFTSAVNLC